jgi:predicted metal-binding membrane protein
MNRTTTKLRPASAGTALSITLGLAVLCWVLAVTEMNGMNAGVETRLGPFAFFIGIWTAMMAAMMLPGAASAVVRRGRVSGVRAVWAFVASYLLVWASAGLLVFALYKPHSTSVAGILVILAGLYEVTPAKRYFRRRCRQRVASGWEYGLCCLGSTAGLTLILLALGPMSVLWMSAVAILVLLQKLLPARPAIDVPVAVAIAGFGLLILLAPAVIPGLTPAMTPEMTHMM